MVQLANSEKLAIRYAPYIQELRDFFALHDVLCGAPRELGFFAARLSGRDTFPDEFASMVRSFIFREGGAFPLADLRTVVAVAVGGPAVAQSAGELQHPLHDLSTFLADIAHASLDQPRPTTLDDQAAESTRTIPYAAASPFPASTDTQEPANSENPLRPHRASNAALSKAPFSSSPQHMSPAALPRPARNRRTLWAALAVGLPLVLLFAFLFHQPSETTPAPESSASPSGPPASSLSSPQSSAPTPLSNAAEALAHPASALSEHPGVPYSAGTGRPRSDTSNPSALSSASPVPAGPSQPTAAPLGTTTPSSPAPVATAPPAAPAPAPSPASAPRSTVAASSSAPRPPSPPSPANPSVATVTAQQGAFGVSSGIMSSHLVSFSPPKYPAMANFTHAQGQVILQAVVSKTGRVSAVKAITGPRTLRKAAEKAVRQWRYRPYVVDGHAADIATIITIDVKAPH